MSFSSQKYPVSPAPSDVTSHAGTGDEPCEECCKNDAPNYFCIDCGSTYCEICWLKVRAHAPGKVNRDGIPHEKCNKRNVERLKEIFTPASDPDDRRQLHETDAETTWFGVTRNVVTNSASLYDYGRYCTIMRNSSTSEYPERWPQLVSFVGQTGKLYIFLYVSSLY